MHSLGLLVPEDEHTLLVYWAKLLNQVLFGPNLNEGQESLLNEQLSNANNHNPAHFPALVKKHLDGFERKSPKTRFEALQLALNDLLPTMNGMYSDYPGLGDSPLSPGLSMMGEIHLVSASNYFLPKSHLRYIDHMPVCNAYDPRLTAEQKKKEMLLFRENQIGRMQMWFTNCKRKLLESGTANDFVLFSTAITQARWLTIK